jgi:transposase InsO family protein
MRFHEPQGQIARWIEELSQFNMVILHRQGRKHGNADALSRIPGNAGHWDASQIDIRLEDLPCGGCRYCRKQHQNWAPFFEAVDYAVPLSKATTMESNGSIVGVVGLSPPSDGVSEVVTSGSATKNCESNMATASCGKTDLASMSEYGKPSCANTEISPKVDSNVNSVLEVDCLVTQETKRLWDSKYDKNFSKGFRVFLDPTDMYMRRVRRPKQSKDPPPSDLNSADESTEPKVGKGTSWGFSIEDLVEAQAKEPDFKFILDWLKHQTMPSEADEARSCPAARFYYHNRQLFTLIDGVIYYLDPKNDNYRLLLPRDLRSLVFKWHHSIPSAGHQGIKRTKERIKDKFMWFGLGQDINISVTKCETCNRNKKATRAARCPLTEYHAGGRMEIVHIDFLGPLPKSARGNEYILVMVDQFTKWVECFPVPNQTAELTARVAVDEFFMRYGVPFQLISDQGRNFESKLFTEVCKLFEIRKTRTTPYRPSANGQVERYNRTIMQVVRCYTGKSQNQWDVSVPQAAGALRASVNRATDFTANEMLFGGDINMPAHIMFPPPPSKTCEDESTYVSELIMDLRRAHETVRTVLNTYSRRMKRNYDRNVLKRQYSVGDVVYLLDTAVIKGKCKKLSAPWKGPAVIIAKLSAFIYRIKLRNAIFVVNHDRIKLCTDATFPPWIVRWKNKKQSLDETMVEDDKVYCLCHKPWGGRFMIQCDYCTEWYHGSCVNISSTDAANIDKYKCDDCKVRGRR